MAAYSQGISFTMLDSYVAPFEAGQFLHAVCAVATSWLTGIGNYVCLREVQDIMQPIHGIMFDLGLKEDGSSWDYLLNREFMDQALRQLAPPSLDGTGHYVWPAISRHSRYRLGYR